MKEVHLIAQGKGGVGKSLVASFFAQYLIASDQDEIHCFDTDPVNPTFSRYKALNVSTVPLLNASNNINSRNFDGLIEKLIELEGIGVVDNGAATFVPLMSYIAENDIDNLLAENGIKLYIHSVIAGGQAQKDCLEGLNKILNGINAKVVVWLNHHFGEVTELGKQFTDLSLYKKNQDKIVKIVELYPLNPDTAGHDIQMVTSLNLTFEEVDSHHEFTLIPRQRLHRIKRSIWEQLAQDELFNQPSNES